MRFKQYITEGMVSGLENGVSINKTLHSKCKYYLSLIKGNNPLYRGMDEDSEGIKKVRQDRKSLGMFQWTADKLNEWLKKHGHVPRDKSVFLTSDYHNAVDFGSPYMIFPIGKFNYTWIEAKDINIDDPRTKWYYDDYLEKFENYKKYSDRDRDKLLKFFNTNKGFYIPYNNGYEIWMDCKEYYYFGTMEYVWFKKEQKIYKKTDSI